MSVSLPVQGTLLLPFHSFPGLHQSIFLVSEWADSWEICLLWYLEDWLFIADTVSSSAGTSGAPSKSMQTWRWSSVGRNETCGPASKAQYFGMLIIIIITGLLFALRAYSSKHFEIHKCSKIVQKKQTVNCMVGQIVSPRKEKWYKLLLKSIHGLDLLQWKWQLVVQSWGNIWERTISEITLSDGCRFI